MGTDRFTRKSGRHVEASEFASHSMLCVVGAASSPAANDVNFLRFPAARAARFGKGDLTAEASRATCRPRIVFRAAGRRLQ